LLGIKLRQVEELIETAVVREYARWCEGTVVQATSYSINPGLSDEGALPRVNETPPTAVRGSILEIEIRPFRTEGT